MNTNIAAEKRRLQYVYIPWFFLKKMLCCCLANSSSPAQSIFLGRGQDGPPPSPSSPPPRLSEPLWPEEAGGGYSWRRGEREGDLARGRVRGREVHLRPLLPVLTIVRFFFFWVNVIWPHPTNVRPWA